MSPAGFEPAIPEVELPQVHASDCAATEIDCKIFTTYISLEPQDLCVI